MTSVPIAPEERIQVIDILRGYALLGILMVNMAFYSQPIVVPFLGEPAGTSGADRVADHAIRWLAEGKFFSLFSLLFGIGLYVQMTRAEARGAAFVPQYARRLLALLAIGALHATLLWSGDILATYAILGFVLLLFRKRKPRTVALWAIGFVVVPLLLGTIVFFLAMRAPNPGARAERVAHLQELATQAWQVYGHGSFVDVTRQRAHDFLLLLPALLRMVPGILCMFLFGLFVARRGLLHDVVANRKTLRRICAVCLPLGIAINALCAFAPQEGAWRLLGPIGVALGGPILCFGYASGIALLSAHEGWRRLLAPLGAGGRMALTNYLLQSLVCSTLFYGYGFGQLGRFGAAKGVVLTFAIWFAELGLSMLWLRRFRYGPAEWLWRSVTYRRLQPMRRASRRIDFSRLTLRLLGRRRGGPVAPALPQLLAHFGSRLSRHQHGDAQADERAHCPLGAGQGGDACPDRQRSSRMFLDDRAPFLRRRFGLFFHGVLLPQCEMAFRKRSRARS
jgi:uncharacterized protein